MNILNKTLTPALAIGCIAAFQTAHASLTTVPITLSSLISQGSSISIGDKTFSDFGYVPTGSVSFDPSLISVSASIDDNGVYYLDWSGVIGVNNLLGSDLLIGDVKLSYSVTANAGSIIMIDQSYTPNVTSSPAKAGDSISIGETVTTPGGVTVANSTLTLTDLSDPTAEAGDNLNFDPQQKLNVVKDIFMSAAGGDFVGLSDVKQSFHQTAVPEPSTVVAGALLLLPFGVSTLRILRKSKVS